MARAAVRSPTSIAAENAQGAGARSTLDYAALGEQLARRGIDIDDVTDRVGGFGVAVPSWGVGTGGTRFARFPGPGEPRDIWEKLDDCAAIQQLARATPRVSLHFPGTWSTTRRAEGEGRRARARVRRDELEHLPGPARAGALLQVRLALATPTPRVRAQAVAHNLECIAFGQALGSKALTVWIGDGSNFPGQSHFARAFERYLDSMARIYARAAGGLAAFIEHKIHEPAFYSTVVQDWGTSY